MSRLTTLEKRLTNSEKRLAVERALLSAPTRSNRAIARECHVDEGTVRKIRKKLEETAEIPQLEERFSVKGYTLTVKRIGRRPATPNKEDLVEVRRKLFAMAKIKGVGRLLSPSIRWLTHEIKRTPESDRQEILKAVREGAFTLFDLESELPWFHPDELFEIVEQLVDEGLLVETKRNAVKVQGKRSSDAGAFGGPTVSMYQVKR
jgi:DNA-binding Lrp family transcriptional regulator